MGSDGLKNKQSRKGGKLNPNNPVDTTKRDLLVLIKAASQDLAQTEGLFRDNIFTYQLKGICRREFLKASGSYPSEDTLADLSQIVIIKALNSLNTLGNLIHLSQVYKWLNTTAYNASIDILRKVRAEKRFCSDDAAESINNISQSPYDRLLLQTAIGRLSLLQRTILQLNISEGRSLSDIANTLNMPESRIKYEKREAIIKLRRFYGVKDAKE